MEEHKLKAAQAALEYIEKAAANFKDSAIKLGLGTGSTAEKFVDLLGIRVAQGLKVRCVPTSEVTKAHAERLEIPLTSLEEEKYLDITVDGADEIDANLSLIKGGGGALLREKIVAMASRQVVIIADQGKMVQNLGRFALPLEVVQFGLGSTQYMIKRLAEEAGCNGEIVLRKDASGKPFITDENHHVLDCAFGNIPDPDELENALSIIPGIVETGLFLGLVDYAFIGNDDGVTMLQANDT